jgi:hypothetical protein
MGLQREVIAELVDRQIVTLRQDRNGAWLDGNLAATLIP